MSKEKRRVPKLRFPGFTEDWEQRKLGDFYTFKNGLNKEKVYFGYGDSIVNFTDVFHNRQIYSSTLKGKVFVNKKELENFKVKEGDLFFTRTSETIDEIGFPAVVMEPMERVVFSGFVLRGRAEKNDPLVNIFKSYIFFTDNFRSEMKKKSSMTTRALTSGTALKEMYFSYPKDLEEQTKIGEILLRLDNVITLHQRKLDNLKLNKKALLQKLFPKNGERYPELRFPGFTDAWEQRKLSDVLVERNEQQVETREYPLMSFVQGLGVTPKGERYDRSFLVLDQSKKYKRTELGDFIYSSNNLETGSIGINKTGKAVISPVYSIFQGVSIGDSQFIGIMSLLPRFIAKMIRFRQGVVYGQWRIHETDFLDISVLIPSVDERTKITQLILSIEELITLHQRKLDHLQLQKKALLQQMFV